MAVTRTSCHVQELLDEEQVPFDDLPDELILLIFSHLSPEDIACRISKVCTRWLIISKDNRLWDGTALVYDDSCCSEFQTTIQFAPSLGRVEINYFKYITEGIVDSLLHGCSNVKYLSFYPNFFLPVEQRLDILRHYQNNLMELDLYIDDSYMSSSNCSKSLFGILSNMANLKMLTLRGDVSSQFVFIEPFKDGWNSLENLDISGFTVRYDALENGQVFNPWQKFILLMLDNQVQTLKILLLPQGIFDYRTVNVFADKFKSSKIEYLKVCENCLLAVKNLAYLRTLHVVGASCRSLNILHLHCLSSSSEYSLIFDWISDTPQFLSIKDLTLENIFDDERQLILKLINACKNLESLTIFAGCSTPAQLAFVISQLPSLKTLNIHRMPCLRSRHLELISFHLPNLTVLNLRYNRLSDGILQHYRDHLQPKMPNLELFCDWGYWNKSGGRQWVTKTQKNEISVKTDMALPKKMMWELDDESGPSSSCGLLPDERAKIRKILSTVNDYEDDD